MNDTRPWTAYTLLLLFIAGMGGFLYGYDIGIIGAALLYLKHTIDLSTAQESAIAAAVLGGGMAGSLVGGWFSDLIGRKKMMIVSGGLFIASVAVIITASSYEQLFAGRAVQGLGAGMIAVVIPLYLAESLPAAIRGRGTAAFQLMLTIGIFIAFRVGTHYTAVTEALIATASPSQVPLLQTGAWKSMFRSAFYPGIIFVLGALVVKESPRWPIQRTKAAAASAPADSLLRRKYLLPFFLACAILALNQTTGINSVLQFLVVILREAGLTAVQATEQSSYVTLVNVIFTAVGLMVVDRLGRTTLLKIGTTGIIAAFITAAALFHQFESRSVNVTLQARPHVTASGTMAIPVDAAALGHPEMTGTTQLTVIYLEHGDRHLEQVPSNAADPVLRIPSTQLVSARFGPVPSHSVGVAMTACLMVFIAAFAVGPGVCVWLALSELMPTRIRSWGMGIGLTINQAISAGIAAAFLPFVGTFGYTAAFATWAGFTVLYFLIAAFLLPETKGRTLEEIEAHFAR
ncbi:MAG TPA: MFS transporter [Opitutaceae bacterium]|jgi:MFS family permease|nr:MFS transporter [Opitutaceae bacterium]